MVSNRLKSHRKLKQTPNATAFVIAFCLLILSFPTLGRTIALTFDDGFDPRTTAHAAEMNAAMLKALRDAGIKSMLLPTGRNVATPEGLKLVRAWGKAGHQIGNHTYSHKNLGARDVTAEWFVADIERQEKVTSAFIGATKAFRFPYLKEGETLEKRDFVAQWLVVHRYQVAAVSVDASDWYFSQRYVAWRKLHATVDDTPYRDAYIAHILGRIAYYDALAKQLLGRSTAHVVLLHTNEINARFLPDLIAAIRAKDWNIVAPSVAYKDALYQMHPNTLPAGESILWALAKEADMEGLRYPAESDEYEQEGIDALERKLDSTPSR